MAAHPLGSRALLSLSLAVLTGGVILACSDDPAAPADGGAPAVADSGVTPPATGNDSGGGVDSAPPSDSGGNTPEVNADAASPACPAIWTEIAGNYSLKVSSVTGNAGPTWFDLNASYDVEITTGGKATLKATKRGDLVMDPATFDGATRFASCASNGSIATLEYTGAPSLNASWLHSSKTFIGFGGAIGTTGSELAIYSGSMTKK